MITRKLALTMIKRPPSVVDVKYNKSCCYCCRCCLLGLHGRRVTQKPNETINKTKHYWNMLPGQLSSWRPESGRENLWPPAHWDERRNRTVSFHWTTGPDGIDYNCLRLQSGGGREGGRGGVYIL